MELMNACDALGKDEKDASRGGGGGGGGGGTACFTKEVS